MSLTEYRKRKAQSTDSQSNDGMSDVPSSSLSKKENTDEHDSNKVMKASQDTDVLDENDLETNKNDDHSEVNENLKLDGM